MENQKKKAKSREVKKISIRKILFAIILILLILLVFLNSKYDITSYAIEKGVQAYSSMMENENEVEELCICDVLVHLSIDFDTVGNIDDNAILGAVVSLYNSSGEKLEEQFIEDSEECYFKDVNWGEYGKFDVEGYMYDDDICYDWGDYNEDEDYIDLYISITGEERSDNDYLRAIKIWDDYNNVDNTRPEYITLAIEYRFRCYDCEMPMSLYDPSEYFTNDIFYILNPEDYGWLEDCFGEWSDWTEQYEMTVSSKENKQEIDIFNDCR